MKYHLNTVLGLVCVAITLNASAQSPGPCGNTCNTSTSVCKSGEYFPANDSKECMHGGYHCSSTYTPAERWWVETKINDDTIATVACHQCKCVPGSRG